MTDAPRVLVHGSSGRVGRHVVRELVVRGLRPRIAVRRPGSVAEPDVHAVRLELADPRTYAAAFEGADAALVLWPPGVGMPRERLLPALEVARTEGVDNFVILSVLGAGTLPFLVMDELAERPRGPAENPRDRVRHNAVEVDR